MFWISYIGAKDSARKFKYTMQVKASEKSQKYHSEGTKWCVPCDLYHDEVKRKVCAIFLDEELVEEAMRGNDGKLWINMTVKHTYGTQMCNPLTHLLYVITCAVLVRPRSCDNHFRVRNCL